MVLPNMQVIQRIGGHRISRLFDDGWDANLDQSSTDDWCILSLLLDYSSPMWSSHQKSLHWCVESR